MIADKLFCNSKIIGSKPGAPRDLRDAGPCGEVITYYLTEEERQELIKKYGPPKQPRYWHKYECKKMTVAQFVAMVPKDELEDMLDKHHTASLVAKAYKVSVGVVVGALKVYGLVARGKEVG